MKPATDRSLLGIGLALILMPLGFVVVQPAHFHTAEFYLRIIASLGAALVATSLPGLLKIDLPGIKAVGALAVLVLFWQFNPPKALNETLQEVVIHATKADQLDGVSVPRPGENTYNWGSDILMDRYDDGKLIAPSSGRRWASWKLEGFTPGRYEVFITYASAEPRPLRMLVDDIVVLPNIAMKTTGTNPVGFDTAHRQEIREGLVSIPKSEVELKLESKDQGQSWPHFKQLRLVPAR